MWNFFPASMIWFGANLSTFFCRQLHCNTWEYLKSCSVLGTHASVAVAAYSMCTRWKLPKIQESNGKLGLAAIAESKEGEWSKRAEVMTRWWGHVAGVRDMRRCWCHKCQEALDLVSDQLCKDLIAVGVFWPRSDWATLPGCRKYFAEFRSILFTVPCKEAVQLLQVAGLQNGVTMW